MENKTKTQKIKVCKRPDSGELTSGFNCQVFLDDVPLKFVKSLRFEVEAGSMAKVTMVMYGDFDLEIDTELEKSEPTSTDYVSNGKPVNLYTLSSPFPAFVAEELDKE